MTKTLIGALALVLVPRAALAAVTIDATEIAWPDDVLAVAAEDFEADVADGAYDDLDARVPVTGATNRIPAPARSFEDGRELLELSSQTFGTLPADVRRQIIQRLVQESYAEGRVPIYRADVDVRQNADALGATRLLGLLQTLSPAMGAQVDASELLGDFARTWAYRESEKRGPNCWHCAIASTSPHWQRARYMSPEEFVCQLDQYYEPLHDDGSDLSHLEFGDVVRLVNREGDEVHGFVYLGQDASAPSKHIVFTKNGYRRGMYLFEDYETVTREIYPGTIASFYRAAHPVPDPEREPSACGRDGAVRTADGPRPDPIIAAGLRALGAVPNTLPATRLAPIEIE